MGFEPRLISPSATDKYWISTSKGGLNECLVIDSKTGSVLPNCVGYAWGRFYELTGDRPNLSKNNAENWYGYNDGYERGGEPKLGAVICWYGKGSLYGHVAIVEAINSDGTIVCSASNYSGTRWYTGKYKKSNHYYIGSNYTFQGFIYPPKYAKEVAPLSQKPIKLKIGYASSGDQKTIGKLLDSLAIVYTENVGYLYTAVAVSTGDQIEIIKLCEDLGVPCVEYKEPSPENEDKDAQIAQLVAQLNSANDRLKELEADKEVLRNRVTLREREIEEMKTDINRSVDILNTLV